MKTNSWSVGTGDVVRAVCDNSDVNTQSVAPLSEKLVTSQPFLSTRPIIKHMREASDVAHQTVNSSNQLSDFADTLKKHESYLTHQMFDMGDVDQEFTSSTLDM